MRWIAAYTRSTYFAQLRASVEWSQAFPLTHGSSARGGAAPRVAHSRGILPRFMTGHWAKGPSRNRKSWWEGLSVYFEAGLIAIQVESESDASRS